MGREGRNGLCRVLVTRALAASLSLAILACDNTGSAKPTAEDSDVLFDDLIARDRVHGYRAARERAAGEAIRVLLTARLALRSNELDLSIRELTKVLCLGSSQDVTERIATTPIEAMYPLDRLAECKQIVCMSFFVDGKYITSDGAERPHTVPPLPGPSQTLP